MPRIVLERLASSWRREPFALAAPFGGDTLVAPSDLFAAWIGCADALRGRAEGLRYHLYRGDQRAPDPVPYLPAASDATFEGWLSRLTAEHGEPEWGLNVSNPQAFDGVVFRRLLTFLDALHRTVGVTRGGAVPDLFFMNHKKSFFGLHKDAQDVVTFVISGRRRFLLWPFEEFRAETRLGPDEGLEPWALPKVDPAAHRGRARVLEGRAGDVLYWPAEWWHAGESTGEPGLTLALGMLHAGHPLARGDRGGLALQRCYAKVTDPLPYSAGPGAAETVAAGLDWIRRIAEDSEIQREVRRDVRTWTSRGGLEKVPPPRADAARPGEDERVFATSASAILYEEGPDRIHGSFAGREVALHRTPGIVAALARLTRGGSCSVSSLVAEAGGLEDRSAVLELLATLERSHALERETG